jgi:aminopeptidase YwaD
VARSDDFSPEAPLRHLIQLLIPIFLIVPGVLAQKPPLLPENDVAELANELSGETAKRNLEGLARLHRQRGSQGFHSAAELVAERLGTYGLSDVAILQFPADGKIFYGTQRSRPAWDAEAAELWEIVWEHKGGITTFDKKGRPTMSAEVMGHRDTLLASFEAEPVVLAEDSESADVTTELVDIGAGTKESDYEGKNMKGKIVLVSAQPGAVQDLAVGKFGAAGIVSYAQNQKTAWSGEDENLIRWGHLETFSSNKTFAFMVSLKTARGFRYRLANGEKIVLRATVKAGQHPGNYEVVTATIPGADPKLKNEEIAFSCHLDHQRPGANDNASGCVTILEVARTLQKLIGEKKLERPARTIRFIFPPEVEGTMALLNAKPELAKHIKAVIHMDMVGGGPETKAVFHVTRGPMSLPSFVHDVAWAFADWLNDQSYRYAAGLPSQFSMTAPEGGKEPLRAEYSPYTMGSDHDVYQDSSFGIPAIYLNDWPDRYIHTNFDTAANIDPTKLKRAAFIGAASGYFFANPTDIGASNFLLAMRSGQLAREQLRVERESSLEVSDRANNELPACLYEKAIESKVFSQLPYYDSTFEGLPPKEKECSTFYLPAGKSTAQMAASFKETFRRKSEPRGPLAVFGYDFSADKGAGSAEPKLLSYEGLWGEGAEYAYEVVNFADGKRNVLQIHDAVSAEYGPVPVDLILEYLTYLEKIGIVELVK